jgi:hypothetical protein
MAPAFATARQAAAFAALLVLLLLAPWWCGPLLLPTRSEIYQTVRDEDGPYRFLHGQIFAGQEDLDLVFIGSSHIWSGVETRRVKAELSRKLGREAQVVTLGWPWAGYDALYFITRDLLEHRRVRMLVFYDDVSRDPDTGAILDHAHRLAPRWCRWREDREALEGVPLRRKSQYYFASILGLPRQLYTRLAPRFRERAYLPGPGYWERKYRGPSLDETEGALTASLGIDHDPRTFVRFAPSTDATADDVVLYTPGTNSLFHFGGPATPPASLHFARKFARLVHDHGARLVLLNLPGVAEWQSSTINERECWPESLGVELDLVGIPPARLFSGLSEQEVRDLYYDPWHFNCNGQTYFTGLVYPRLLELYEDTSRN